jgi:hypothetical protein
MGNIAAPCIGEGQYTSQNGGSLPHHGNTRAGGVLRGLVRRRALCHQRGAGNEESREGETLGAGRLVGAVLAEQTDEWAGSGRHYMSLAVIAKTLAPLSTEAMLEVTMVAA